MATPTRHDILASNLLFATLALTVLFQVAGWVARVLAPHQTLLHPTNFNVLTVAGTLVFVLVRGAFYYGVRRGVLAIKVLVALGFVVFCYTTTRWSAGLVAGVYFPKWSADTVVFLLNNLLTLAALVVMFWPTRRPAAEA